LAKGDHHVGIGLVYTNLF